MRDSTELTTSATHLEVPIKVGLDEGGEFLGGEVIEVRNEFLHVLLQVDEPRGGRVLCLDVEELHYSLCSLVSCVDMHNQHLWREVGEGGEREGEREGGREREGEREKGRERERGREVGEGREREREGERERGREREREGERDAVTPTHLWQGLDAGTEAMKE